MAATLTLMSLHTSAPSDGAQRGRTSGRPFLVLAVVLPASFMQLIDVSIVNVAIPSIQRDLGASYASVQLVLVGYTLAFACLLITSARLGDLYGRRKLFLLGMVGFTVASALCGAAPSATALVVARVIQGLMSGLMFPQVLSVIQLVFPPRERPKAFAVYGATVGLATILGPTMGGLLIQADLFGQEWRSIFYVNVPIGVVAFVAAVRILPESRNEHARRLDLPGALLITAGLFLLVYPLTEGRERGWPGWIWAMLATSAPLLAAFVAYERRRSARDDSPLVDMRLFGISGFRTGLPLATIFFAGVPPFFFLFSLYLQIGEGFSPLRSGLTTLPFAVGSAFASARSASLARRLGKYTLAIGLSLLMTGITGVILTVTLVGAEPSSWVFLPTLLIAGLGLGSFIAPNTSIILAAVPGRSAGSASGVLSTGQQVGGSLGVALAGVIFFGVLGAHASTAANAAQKELRPRLAAVLPAAAVEPALASFEQCFVDRTKESDPSAVPESCRSAQGEGSAGRADSAVSEAIAQAADQARRATFSTALRWSLGYELAVFGLALLLVFRLPAEASPEGATRERT